MQAPMQAPMLPCEIILYICELAEREDVVAGFRIAGVCRWLWDMFGVDGRGRMSTRGKQLRVILRHVHVMDWLSISNNKTLPEEFFWYYARYMNRSISSNRAIGMEFIREHAHLYDVCGVCANERIARENLEWFDRYANDLAWDVVCGNAGITAEWLQGHRRRWVGSQDCLRQISARQDMLPWLACNLECMVPGVVAATCQDPRWLLTHLRFVWTHELFDNACMHPVIEWIINEPLFGATIPRRGMSSIIVPRYLRGTSTYMWRETIPDFYCMDWLDWARMCDLDVHGNYNAILQTMMTGSEDIVRALLEMRRVDAGTAAWYVSQNPNAVALLESMPHLRAGSMILNPRAGHLVNWSAPLDISALARAEYTN
jgi:hypothetical protein